MTQDTKPANVPVEVGASAPPARRCHSLTQAASSWSEGTTHTHTDDDLDLTNLPPGRMHAVKGTHHRLHGSAGNLMETLRDFAGTPRSRSRSPSIGRDGRGGTMTTHDANSSISSYDDFDQDILTDRAGMQDDLSDSQRKIHSSRSELHLPSTVMERMSEDSLEDNQAFCDVARSSNASRVSHVSGSNGDIMLEPLDECDEGLEDDNSSLEGDDEDYHKDGTALDHHKAAQQHTTTVILTNMENLTFKENDNDDYSNANGGGGRTGESSLVEEAPSAPTM